MKKSILVAALAAFTMGLVACNQPAPQAATVSELTINEDYKKQYYVNDEFDSSSLTVTAHYSDSSTKVLTYNTGADTDYTLQGFNTRRTGPLTFAVIYQKKMAQLTVEVVAAPEEPINITISVTVSGITTYEEDHTHIWLNSTVFGASDPWPSSVLTRSGETHTWTVVVESVLPGAYFYDFYYGTETAPNWTDGKNVRETTGDQSFFVEADKASYTFDATFSVKEFDAYVDVDVVASPSVVAESEGSPVELSEGVNLFAWSTIENSIKFEKGTDNKWHHTLRVPLSNNQGSFQITFVLGIDNEEWSYQWGAWEDGSWVTWNSSKFDVTNTDTSVSVSPIFKSQPEVVDPATAYNVTFTLKVTEGTTLTWLGLCTGSASWAGNDLVWIDSFSFDSETSTWSFAKSYADGTEAFNFAYKGGGTGYDSAWIGADTSWHAFHLEFDQLGDVTVAITLSEDVTANGIAVGSVSATNCTVTTAA